MVDLVKNDFVYGWAEDPDVEGAHSRRAVMLSEYVVALEARVGASGQNQIRVQLHLPTLPVFEENNEPDL